jgi:hypothetical protein
VHPLQPKRQGSATNARSCAQGRLRKDLEVLEREKVELQDKINSLQQTIMKGNEKMDQFKLLMNWNQEELDQWVLAQKQKEEDNLALEKYKRQDEAKIKELTLQVTPAPHTYHGPLLQPPTAQHSLDDSPLTTHHQTAGLDFMPPAPALFSASHIPFTLLRAACITAASGRLAL